MALPDKKLDPDAPVDPALAAAIRARLEGGLLPCAAACSLAGELGREAIELGRAADALQVHLTACQLGLFGYPGHAKGWEGAGVAALPAPAVLESALAAARDESGALTCLAAWRAAAGAGCSRMQAGWAAEKVGIKIRACQLGAF